MSAGGRRWGPGRARGLTTVLVAAAVLVGCTKQQAGDDAREGPEPSAGTPAPAGEWRQEWSWHPPVPASLGMPAADAGGVALTSARRFLVLLDGATGAQVWRVEHPGVRNVAPLLTGREVVVATDEGLVAVDRATGATRWTADLGDRANTPVAAGGRLVATTWEGGVLAVDPGSGRVAWTARVAGGILGPAAAGRDGARDLVVVTWDSGRAAGVSAFDAATGAARWEVRVPPDGVSAPVVVDGGPEPRVVLVAGDATVRALSLATGATRWSVPVEGAGSPELAPVAPGGGRVVAAHRLGGLVALAAADGAVEWEAASPEAAVQGGVAGPGPSGAFVLTLADGRLLVGGPDRPPALVEPPGLALTAGVARLPSGWLVVATTQSERNEVVAISGW